MNKKLLVFCIVFLIAAGCAPQKQIGPAEAQQLQDRGKEKPGLTFSVAVTSEVGKEFQDLMKKCASENGIELLLYDEDLLGTADNMLSGAKLGTVGMIVCNAGRFAREYPEWSLLTMPGLFTEPKQFNEWFSGTYKERINSDADSLLRVLAVAATDEKYLFTNGPIEITEGLSTVSMNLFDTLYWNSFGVNVYEHEGPFDKRSIMENKAGMIAASKEMFAALSLERRFSGIVPAKIMLDCVVVAVNRSAWERRSFEEQKLLERFADCVYGELINKNTESVDVFAAKNHLTVYLPGYHVREKLLRRDELINKYKEVLGAEYVDFFLESVSRFNNKYTVR